MEEPIVIFETYLDSVQANLVKERLEAHGIHCFLADEHMANLNLIPNQTIGGIKLKMFERDVLKARKILLEENLIPESELRGMVFCPRCKSFRISAGAGVQKQQTVWAFIRSLLSELSPFHIHRWYHCMECHHEFKK